MEIVTSIGPRLHYRLDDLVVDVGRREVLRGEEKLPVAGLSFDLLVALIRAAPNLVTYDELMERVWPGVVVSTETVTQRVKLVRDALDDDPRAPRYIHGVRGRGYRIALPVVAVPALVDEPVQNGAPIAKRPRRRLLWVTIVATVIGTALAIPWLTSPSTPRFTTYRQITQSRDAFAPYLSPIPIVTDGPRLYFSEWVLPKNAVGHIPRQVSITGGESVPVGLPFDPEDTNVVIETTPDRAELVVGKGTMVESEVEFWLWAPAGRSPRRLGDFVGHDITYTPDGRTLIYTNGADLLIANADGTGSRTLLTAPARAYWPKVSPDGERIRFSIHEGEYFRLWEATIDGSGLHQLLAGWNDPADECCGSWTPDGRYYVFQATRQGVSQIWSVRENGGVFDLRKHEPFQVTTGPMQFVRPLLSADGRTIYAVGTHMRGTVMRHDPTAKRFIPHFGERSAEWLWYSNDGQWTTYLSYPSGDLWRSRADGSDALKLTSAPLRPNAASRWSPDGKRIAFDANTPGDTPKIYLVDADGDTPKRLTSASRPEWYPTWSPDATQLAFSTPDGIRIVDLESGSDSALEGGEQVFAPDWSPDGKHIAGVTKGRVVVFEVGERRWREALRLDDPNYARWSGDGQYLYVVTHGKSTLRIRYDDLSVEHTGSAEKEPWMFGRFGSWVGLAPDGSPLYLRDERVQHIYALDWET